MGNNIKGAGWHDPIEVWCKGVYSWGEVHYVYETILSPNGQLYIEPLGGYDVYYKNSFIERDFTHAAFIERDGYYQPVDSAADAITALINRARRLTSPE